MPTAAYLVTGDKDLLALAAAYPILSPADFWGAAWWGLTNRRAALGAISATRYSRGAEDDKFVHVALAGAADMIVSADQDLLSLHPVNGLPVLSPADALRAFAAGSM